MIIHKLFLYGAVEPLAMRIHLGSAGVGVVMDQMQSPQFFIKMLHEFRAVVGEHEDKGIWKYHPAIIKELLCEYGCPQR